MKLINGQEEFFRKILDRDTSCDVQWTKLINKALIKSSSYGFGTFRESAVGGSRQCQM